MVKESTENAIRTVENTILSADFSASRGTVNPNVECILPIKDQ